MENKIDSGPLKALIGVWKGDTGVDLAPKPDEDENNPYYEVLTIEPVDIDIENAEEQELTAVRYHQVVREKANDKVSHSETGYWIWDKDENKIMVSFSIPRGVCVLAGGYISKSDDGLVFNVLAEKDNPNWTIIESPFMSKKATTISFKRELKITGNTLSYSQTTVLDIYGKIFNHEDKNELKLTT